MAASASACGSSADLVRSCYVEPTCGVRSAHDGWVAGPTVVGTPAWVLPDGRPGGGAGAGRADAGAGEVAAASSRGSGGQGLDRARDSRQASCSACRVRSRRGGGERLGLCRGAAGSGPEPCRCPARCRAGSTRRLGRRRRPDAPGGGRLVSWGDGAPARSVRGSGASGRVAVRPGDRRHAGARRPGRRWHSPGTPEDDEPPSPERDGWHSVLRAGQHWRLHAVRLAAAVPPDVRELSRGGGSRPAGPVLLPVPVRAWSSGAARGPGRRERRGPADTLAHLFRRLAGPRRDHVGNPAQPRHGTCRRSSSCPRCWAWDCSRLPCVSSGARSPRRAVRAGWSGPCGWSRSGCSGSWGLCP